MARGKGSRSERLARTKRRRESIGTAFRAEKSASKRREAQTKVKQVVESKPINGSISVSRSREGGGSIIVSKSGLVTEKDSRGRTIRQFKGDPDQIKSFISEESRNIGFAVAAQKSVRGTSKTKSGARVPSPGADSIFSLVDSSKNFSQSQQLTNIEREGLGLPSLRSEQLSPIQQSETRFTPGGTISAAPSDLKSRPSILKLGKEQFVKGFKFDPIKRDVPEFKLSKAEQGLLLGARTGGLVSSIILTGGKPTSSTASGSVVSGIKKIDEAFDFARTSKFSQAITKGKTLSKTRSTLLIETPIKITEAAIIRKGITGTSEVLKPTTTKLTEFEKALIPDEKQIKKDIFETARSAQIKAEFKIIPAQKFPKTRAFVRGALSEFVPLASPKRDVFTKTARGELSKLKLPLATQEKFLLDLERRRKAFGFSQTVNILQAESFANILGGRSLTKLFKTGKVGTTASERFFRFGKTRLGAGFIEGAVGTQAIRRGRGTQSSLFPNFEKIPGTPSVSSLDDPNIPTKTFNITRAEFESLNITETKPNEQFVNKIFNIKEEPITSFQFKQGESGKDIIQTVTQPITSVTLSKTTPATQVTSKFRPGEILSTLGGGTIGAATAGSFAGLEGVVSKSKIGKRVVGGLGFGLDAPELPGDIVTPILTASKRTKTISNIPLFGAEGSSAKFNQDLQTFKNQFQLASSKKTKGFGSLLDTKGITQQRVVSKNFVSAATKISTKTKAPIKTTATKTEVESFQNIIQRVNEKTQQKTQNKAFTDAFTTVITPRIIIPPVLPGGGGGGGFGRGRIRRSKRRTTFLPSIAGAITGKGAKAGELLTGLEARVPKIKF